MNCIAPMVDGSDFSYRQFIKNFNVTHFWTPMYNVNVILEKKDFLAQVENALSNETNKITVELAGNSPALFEQVVLHFKKFKCIEFFELNLGCSEMIAEKGAYGSYLDDQNRIIAILGAMSKAGIKLSVKTRIQGTIEKTREFLVTLINNNVRQITVHARQSKERIGCYCGDCQMRDAVEMLADLKIRYPEIQFIYNGGVFFPQQITYIHERSLGVMVGQNLLWNPLLFCKDNKSCEALIESAYNSLAVDPSIEKALLFQDELNVEYQYYDLFDGDIFESVSSDKIVFKLRENADPIIFFPINEKILHIKSIALYLGYFTQSLESNAEWVTSALIMHVMSIIGRDLMKLNTDIRDIIVGKRGRNKEIYQGDDGQLNWCRYKIEEIKCCVVRLVGRLEGRKGHYGVKEDEK